MTNQRDKSPCCKAILYVFARGGSNTPGVVGPYVMCTECRTEYLIDYRSGDLLVWIKNDKGIVPKAMLATAKLSDETTITRVLPEELPWDTSEEPHVTFWKREFPVEASSDMEKVKRKSIIEELNAVITKALDEDQPMANALYEAGFRKGIA